jgi:hypothetical protein
MYCFVLASAAVEHVVARITVEDVGTTQAVEHVVPAEAADHVASPRALEHVLAARADYGASSPTGIRRLGESSHCNSHRGSVLGAMTIRDRVGEPVAAAVVLGLTVDEGAIQAEGQRAVFRLRDRLRP